MPFLLEICHFKKGACLTLNLRSNLRPVAPKPGPKTGNFGKNAAHTIIIIIPPYVCGKPAYPTTRVNNPVRS